ncbi:TPA: polymer-forming cytoskeletal protein [Salmonella enterica]|nr:polymer-forming cytoskeletal protein [Salmonella enterica]
MSLLEGGQTTCRSEYLPLLYVVYVLWGGGLIARLAGFNILAVGLLAVALIFFVGVFLPLSGGRMLFNRKKSRPVDGQKPTLIDAMSPTESGLTVIAVGAVVEGDILQGENVSIYGEFTGDIRLQGGSISIHHGGCVRGNLSASTVLIGGHMEGLCEGQNVTILENGVLHGICRSPTFSINPGGGFIGTAEAGQEDMLVREEAYENANRESGENHAHTSRTAIQKSLEEEGEQNATSVLCE